MPLVLPEYLTPPPVPLRILMMTDDNGHFSAMLRHYRERGLNAVVDALRARLPWANVTIRTAHRDAAGNTFADTAELKEFRFDAAGERALSNFDEVWLFGIASGGYALSDGELAALHAYMDADHGVLAMGDHPPNGNPLCSRIRRIAQMVSWNVGRPEMIGPTRHDTRIDMRDPMFGAFDAQGQNQYEDDDVPQTIHLSLRGGTSLYLRALSGYPHPLLCGPRGPIDVMPDHMHEGWVLEPGENLADFDGIPWEVIAYGFNRAGGATQRMFGLIGAWDGEPVDKGRLVVQSTWHHFVWLNVQGFVNATSAAGRAHWQQITAYYRNLALWLAPRPRREQLLQRALWAARWQERIDEELPTANPDSIHDVAFIGRRGMDVLGLAAGRCWTMQILWLIIGRLAPMAMMMKLMHPWSGDEKLRDRSLLGEQPLLDAVVGGILLRIHKEFPSFDVKPERIKELDKQLPELVEEGARHGLRLFSDALQDSLKLMNEAASELANAFGKQG